MGLTVWRVIETHLGRQSHTSRDEQSAAVDTGGHHGELALLHKVDEVLDLFTEGGFIFVLLLVGIRGLAAGVGVAEGHSGWSNGCEGSR